jgi:ubiquinone/menaquinone biosynthesis C-methylase UbiE
MILAQRGKQDLERVPEKSSAVTVKKDDVLQYGQVMQTALAVAYAVGLTVVHRARPDTASKALDLASGPGHYTLCLQTHLKYEDVTGIDLSEEMVALARKNAREMKLEERVAFQPGDITDLTKIGDNVFDLTSFTDAAHHMRAPEDAALSETAAARNMRDLKEVGKVLSEMDRVTKPDGLVMVMDLARLRTAALTENYVSTIGASFREKLPNFYQQFYDSMYAAWTYSELRTAIPQDSRRVWCHLVPKELPTTQVILGLPVGRQRAFLRKGYPWRPGDCPVPKEYRLDWFFARTTLFSAKPKYIPAAVDNAA